MDNNNLNIKTVRVCRTCMEEIIINTSFFHLDFTQIESEPTIRQKLSNCIPELDLSIVPNTVICGKCADTINALYIFKKECLQLEMQIREYIQQVHHTGNDIDLAAVVQFHQLHSKNLVAELKTEAFEKTENYKNEESTTFFCDNYAFNETENETEENTATGAFKKTENYKNEEPSTSFGDYYAFNETERYTEIANKEYLTTLQMVDRQCVLFNTFENFINSDKSETEENSDTNGDSNIVQDCLLQVVENSDICIQNLNKTTIYYQCFACGHKAESKLKLIRHLKSHNAFKKLYQKKISYKSYKTLLCWYRCDLCNYSTKHKCLFSFHNTAHLTKKDYLRILKSRPIPVNSSINTITFGKKDSKIKCGNFSSNKHNFKYWGKAESKQHSNQCNVSKLSSRNLKKSLKIEKQFKCSVCEYSCNHKASLKSHMLNHTGEKPFKCGVCEYSCNQKGKLKNHMLTHVGEKPFKCSVCEFSCIQKQNFKIHMLTHTGERLFNCSVCEYSCNYKQNLKDHMLTHTGEKPFKCSICEYSCNSKRHLKSHMLIHTAEKPFKCSVCEYTCRRKGDLKHHMLTHTGAKPFKCAICKYSFKDKRYLKSHLLTHTGEKSFKCSVCEFSCNKKTSLKRHMLTHTGEKPFKCSVCEYNCNQKNSLKSHLLTHTGEKPFKCSVCEFSCNKKTSLKRHMLTHTYR